MGPGRVVAAKVGPGGTSATAHSRHSTSISSVKERASTVGFLCGVSPTGLFFRWLMGGLQGV